MKTKMIMRGFKLDQIVNVAAYAWNSPGLAAQNHTSNYIIDFIRFMPRDGNLPQGARDLCTDEGCLGFGYTVVASTKPADGVWRRACETRSLCTTFVSVKEGNYNRCKVYIQIIKRADECDRVLFATSFIIASLSGTNSALSMVLQAH